MAKEIADSKLLDTWGSSGTKIEPDISKIIEGWQLGEQPPHEYMNWLQNTFGSKLNHILKNGVASWNNETEYLAGATLQHNGNIWICQETNVNSEPTEVNNNWDKIPSIENLALTVDTVGDLQSGATTGDTCIVKDLDRGGIFIYDSTKVSEDNQGTNFNGWIRQYSGAVNVKWFGAKGDGTTDDTIPLQACADYCNNNRLTMWWPDGGYRTTGTITISHNAGLVMETRVVLQNKGVDKSFAAIRITGGGGRRRILGTIDGYGDGLFLEGNTSNVDFQIISNCTRGVVIAAITSSSLDNVVKGLQIGLCTEGITFLQDGKRTQQGNEVRVNFVSNTKHSLVFDDQGTHTSQSNWDSNLVVLQASDPYYIPGATLLYNKSGFGVANLTYSIETWAGGWNLDDGTMVVIKGKFVEGYFTFNFATVVSSAIFCEATNKASIDSCSVLLKRKGNLGVGVAAAYNATPPGNLSAFNSGKEITRGVFRVKLSHPAMAPGDTHGQSFYHFLSQTSHGARFKIHSIEKGADAGNYYIHILDAGTEYRGMVRTFVKNMTNDTIPAGDIYIVVGCNG